MVGRAFLVLMGACQFGHGVGGFATNFIHSFCPLTRVPTDTNNKNTQNAGAQQHNGPHSTDTTANSSAVVPGCHREQTQQTSSPWPRNATTKRTNGRRRISAPRARHLPVRCAGWRWCYAQFVRGNDTRLLVCSSMVSLVARRAPGLPPVQIANAPSALARLERITGVPDAGAPAPQPPSPCRPGACGGCTPTPDGGPAAIRRARSRVESL